MEICRVSEPCTGITSSSLTTAGRIYELVVVCYAGGRSSCQRPRMAVLASTLYPHVTARVFRRRMGYMHGLHAWTTSTCMDCRQIPAGMLREDVSSCWIKLHLIWVMAKREDSLVIWIGMS